MLAKILPAVQTIEPALFTNFSMVPVSLSTTVAVGARYDMIFPAMFAVDAAVEGFIFPLFWREFCAALIADAPLLTIIESTALCFRAWSHLFASIAADVFQNLHLCALRFFCIILP